VYINLTYPTPQTEPGANVLRPLCVPDDPIFALALYTLISKMGDRYFWDDTSGIPWFIAADRSLRMLHTLRNDDWAGCP
jgi:hypothetical protein